MDVVPERHRDVCDERPPDLEDRGAQQSVAAVESSEDGAVVNGRRHAGGGQGWARGRLTAVPGLLP